MKKLLILFFVFILGICKYNAECSYKDLKELNTFAAYVETSYKYNEETGYFDLTITNLKDMAYITDDYGEYFAPTDGSVLIDQLYLGQTYKVNVMASDTTNCPHEQLRVIYVRLPYKNPYYRNSGCVGHESLNVCNSEFLDYEVSWETFLSLLKKDTKSEVKEPDKKPVDDGTFWNKVIDFTSKIYIKVILVTVTSIISISIYSVVIRKAKHGF